MRLRFKCWSICRRAVMPIKLIRGSKDFLKMLMKMWRQEWSKEGFSLKYHTPEHFTRCHWQKAERVTSLWIVYRAFTAVYFVLSFVYTLIPIGQKNPEENRDKYLIFLTHWTYLLEVSLFVLALIIVLIKVVKEKKNPTAGPMNEMPWYYKIYWIIYTITVSAAIIVSLVFWTFVYDEEKYPFNASNFIEHFLNSFFIIIDFWLVGHPVKFLHFYFPACYGIIYMFFSIIYQLSGGTGIKGDIGIYKILDWEKPGSALLTCALTHLLLMIVHFLFGCFSVCKNVVKRNRSET